MSSKKIKNDKTNEKPDESKTMRKRDDTENEKDTKKTFKAIDSIIYDIPQPKPFAEMEFKCQKTKEFLMWINGEFETEENKVIKKKIEEV